MFDAYDRIRIVNLARRTDRRAEMMRELDALGLAKDPRVEFFAAHSFPEAGLFYSPGARGCFSSHMTIVREAAEAQASVLILEDDATFAARARECLIPPCDIFYGGVLSAANPDDLQQSDLVGSHCIGFSAACVQRLLPWLEAAWTGDDPASIDGEYVRFRRANPDLVTVFADPFIAFQRPSRTDVGEQKWFDRIVGVRTLAEQARRVLSKLRGRN